MASIRAAWRILAFHGALARKMPRERSPMAGRFFRVGHAVSTNA
jgi:hypothetical protein